MKRIYLSTLLISFFLISCKNSNEKADIQELENQTNSELSGEDDMSKTAATDFDITKIPLSNFSIEEIPFFNLPDGYEYSSKNNRDYESIRFWTGNDFELPEGSLFYGRISMTENKQFSLFELTKILDNFFKEAGGVQLFQGKVPMEAIDKNEELIPITDYDLKTTAYGFQGYAKTWTYAIRQSDQNIWIQLNESDDSASLYIAILKTMP